MIKRLVLAVVVLLTMFTAGQASAAPWMTTTEVLPTAQQGPSGHTPSYLEVHASFSEGFQPFDVVVIDAAAASLGQVLSVATVSTATLDNTYLLHDGSWPGDVPGSLNTSLNLSGSGGGGGGGGARAILLYDHLTNFPADGSYVPVIDDDYVSALVYSTDGTPIASRWQDDALTLRPGHAVYRAADGQGTITGPVDADLTFANGQTMDPGLANPWTLDSATFDDAPLTSVPEPTSAALLSILLVTLATRRTASR
ncbi:MAG: PEP-CTERM sorting domain-containing protein [Phycisphaeraceae bacterium]